MEMLTRRPKRREIASPPNRDLCSGQGRRNFFTVGLFLHFLLGKGRRKRSRCGGNIKKALRMKLKACILRWEREKKKKHD
ncbi:hypothetical protein CEXT_35441 [Caerostris extrusa]|uniref:Uncharacterized protein n=1 Tax=Caerostris extrusa TaxID=172846 RepID=A0AAV4UHW9_CAEEX|nr:hypothetical protein CEXT_35441 [Caerostris extrusa]